MKYTCLFLLVLLVLTGCNFGFPKGPKVIYGVDNRLDMYQVMDRAILVNAKAVASSWYDYQLIQHGEKYYGLRTSNFGSEYRLADTEPFINQPIGAHCTAFLVAEDVVVTAGHCLNQNDFLNRVFVFGFQMESKWKANEIINKDQVYFARKIIAHQLSSTGMDYAIVKLDRPVKGIMPLKLATVDAKKGDVVYILGHPCGLPLKLAHDAKVVDSSSNIYFNATLDSYGGNSGSPVFNQKNEVVGILVRGETDFVNGPNGRVSRQGLFGESCTKVSNWAKLIK